MKTLLRSLKPALLSIATATLLAVTALAPAAPAEDFTIAAAASLQDALNELQPALTAELPGSTLRISTGASGTLQQQIAQGAPIDVFLSAAEKPVLELERSKQLTPGSTVELLTNELVLIAPKKSSLTSIAALTAPQVKRIAIGEPRSVPAGDYAMQALTALKLDKDLSAKFLFAKDVRQVLSYVERGEVDAGFVYKSDLQSEAGKGVTMVAGVPADTHQPIRYFAAAVAASKQQEKAQKLLAFLTGPKAAVVWAKYGFSPRSPLASVEKAAVRAPK